MIENVEVKTSSVIIEMKYDIDSNNYLFIAFKTGRVYRYNNINGKEWRGLRDSHSKGSYFNRYIRSHYIGYEFYE